MAEFGIGKPGMSREPIKTIIPVMTPELYTDIKGPYSDIRDLARAEVAQITLTKLNALYTSYFRQNRGEDDFTTQAALEVANEIDTLYRIARYPNSTSEFKFYAEAKMGNILHSLLNTEDTDTQFDDTHVPNRLMKKIGETVLSNFKTSDGIQDTEKEDYLRGLVNIIKQPLTRTYLESLRSYFPK